MYVSNLALTDFRNYHREILQLHPGITTFIGENGQGKTNIVEAVDYLATLGSHRVSSDSALIRQGAQAAVVQARVVTGGSATTVEVEIFAGRANRARINRGHARPAEILGIVRTVLFSPEDLDLVRGDPAGRRAFLDGIMVQLRPRLAGVKSEYDRVLRQRGALLQSMQKARRRGARLDFAALEVWDQQLAHLGGQIVSARSRIVAGLRPFVRHYYALVSGNSARARIDYAANTDRGAFTLPAPEAIAGDPDWDDDAAHLAASDSDSQAGPVALIAAHERELEDAAACEQRIANLLTERREDEVTRGVNLVGPHRDELRLALGSLPAKGYASHGESWSFALALRLASWQLLRTDASGQWAGGSEPILILDDVFAELDARRRQRLAHLVREADQVLVTQAVGDDLPAELSGDRFLVRSGTVTPLGNEDARNE